MLLVDTMEKVFKKDEVIKSHLANLRPVGSWLQEVRISCLVLIRLFRATVFICIKCK